MAEEKEAKLCPFGEGRECSDSCALRMQGNGDGACAFTVIAISVNQQLALEAQAAQMQQEALSRAIMSQPMPRSGSGLTLF